MDALRSTAEEKNIDIQQPRFAAGLRDYPRLEMSRPELVRAFKNIYHNAVKYSYSGRGLGDSSTYPNRWISTVVGRESDLEFFIEIQNYGIGITPEEIPRVFDEGFRGKYSIDRHRTGSGIGLSQVKKIILRHSGQVSITSERAGKPYRTTARVVLPYNQGTGVVRYDEDLEDALG
jgi:signal transduction histidine kinase